MQFFYGIFWLWFTQLRSVNLDKRDQQSYAKSGIIMDILSFAWPAPSFNRSSTYYDCTNFYDFYIIANRPGNEFLKPYSFFDEYYPHKICFDVVCGNSHSLLDIGELLDQILAMTYFLDELSLAAVLKHNSNRLKKK